MDNYRFIIHPYTGKIYDILNEDTKEGQKILKRFIKNLKKGGMDSDDGKRPPPKIRLTPQERRRIRERRLIQQQEQLR